ncbi:biotin--[acetyl-CoA-carboxylase] ligase [Arenibacterium sp. CAU 1754]
MSTDTPLWDVPETAQFWPDGYGRIVLEETDSTMAEARRCIPELSGPTWIMARRQTAGQGRRGRPWVNPDGNFAATLVMRPTGTPAEAALRSFTAAVALYYTLGKLIDRQKLGLKWPNDILLNGGKVSGILLESSGQGGQTNWLSIGIGVNLIAAPDAGAVEPGAVRPVSVVGEGGERSSPEDFLFWLAGFFADHERLFQEFGFGPIRRLWLRHAARLGESVMARTGNSEITGVFETVDEAGQLVLNTPKGRVGVSAAEVFF